VHEELLLPEKRLYSDFGPGCDEMSVAGGQLKSLPSDLYGGHKKLLSGPWVRAQNEERPGAAEADCDV